MPIITPLIIGGTIAAGTAVNSEIRRSKAEKALRKSKTPSFSPTPQTTSMYERTLKDIYTPQGLGQEELNAANQDIAQGATTTYRLATNAGGGNNAQSINAAIAAGMFGARGNLARLNASRKFANRQMGIQGNAQVTGVLQGQKDQNTNMEYERIKALGQAAQEARMERDNALNGISNSAFGVGGMQMGANPSGMAQQTQTNAPVSGSTSMSRPLISGYNPSSTGTFQKYNRNARVNNSWFIPEEPNMLSTGN